MRRCPHAAAECKTCFKERVSSIQTAASATPSRFVSRNRSNGGRPSTKQLNNQWEAGTPTDDRGVPYLDAHGAVVKNKQFSEQRRKWRRS